VEHVVEGDTVTEVLGYVQYERRDLVQRLRRASEDALRQKTLTFEESALLMKRFEEGLSGYTYLEEAEEYVPLTFGSAVPNGGNGVEKAVPAVPAANGESAAKAAEGKPAAAKAPEPKAAAKT
jgi:hypothetical protein